MYRVFALCIGLLLAPSAWSAASNDPAYVDGPAGRAVQDPARADSRNFGQVSPASAALIVAVQQAKASRAAAGAEQQAMLAQATASPQAGTSAEPSARQEYARQIGLNHVSVSSPIQPGTPADAGNTPMQQLGRDPMQQPGSGPMQQMGGALMQDAAGLMDARIQREIYGPQGPVVQRPMPGGYGP